MKWFPCQWVFTVAQQSAIVQALTHCGFYPDRSDALWMTESLSWDSTGFVLRLYFWAIQITECKIFTLYSASKHHGMTKVPSSVNSMLLKIPQCNVSLQKDVTIPVVWHCAWIKKKIWKQLLLKTDPSVNSFRSANCFLQAFLVDHWLLLIAGLKAIIKKL